MNITRHRIDKRFTRDGRTIRFTSFIDSESRKFENEANDILTDIAFEQTLDYAENCSREFLLLQIRDASAIPVMQACVYLGHPRWMKGIKKFGMATAPQLQAAKNASEEEFGIQILRELCAEISSLMTLRLQPLRFNSEALTDFQARSLRHGFTQASPLGPTRTLILNLDSTPEAFASNLSQKTRSKFRSAGRDRVICRPLTEDRFIQICSDAATAARKRSGSTETSYDFTTAFQIAKKHPEKARVLGLFLKNRPEELLAYVIGFRNNKRAEYASAGSFGDPELRSLPFNYFLLGDLIQWARPLGSTYMDLGGITDGGPSDPLAGISRFKRSLTNHEIETSREMLSILSPLQFRIYQTLKPSLKQNQAPESASSYPKNRTPISTPAPTAARSPLSTDLSGKELAHD